MELTFAPNPELPSDIVETLEMDYPIENGELKVITNIANEIYAERRFSVRDLESDKRHWIHLDNKRRLLKD